MAPTVDINYLAVLVSAIVSMGLGALWYSPMIFGKMWMKLMNIDEKSMKKAQKKEMGKSYAIAFAASLLMAYVLAHFVDYAQAKTALEGMQAGFWIWLGFVATITLNSVLWEGRPWKLYLINAAHYFVSLQIMGAILAVWV